jgi:hypothetical protein
MKIKLTNEQVFNVVYVLKTKYPDLEKFDKRFNFAVTRTLAVLQPIAADLLRARESGVLKFAEFEQKKQSIISSHSVSGDFKSDEEKNNCQEEVIKLAEEYKEVLAERSKEIEIYNEILEQEIEVDVVQCKFEAIPNDFNFDILRILVKETDEEIEAML